MRSLLRWFLFTLCLLVFTGAMGWISLRMLSMEAQRRHTAEDAQVQEKVRLALWRMDSLASALLIRENARPAYHYQAFYAPDDLFASRTESIPKGRALMPSPLFGSLPDLVQLHFEKMPDQPTLSSPQAPMGKQKELATSWYTLNPQTSIAAKKLARLDSLLEKHPDIQKAPTVSATPVIEIKSQSLENAPKESLKSASKTLDLDPQSVANATEQSQRALILDNNINLEKKELPKPQLKKAAPLPSSKTTKEGADIAATAPNRSSVGSDSTLGEVTRRYQQERSTDPSAALTRQSLPTLAGDLQPLWVENELLLVRQATVEEMPRLQGVWLDWALLQSRLLDTIRDLLPEATLLPVAPDIARTDATALVTLPVKLITGRIPMLAVETSSPLKSALVVAWTCLIVAALAIAFVLHRAVLLSERRGAFVSAVTHELRTPLTTFRLYSEMLADDMVPDAAQRRSYLQTLCDESTRLMHLVENVLAYSRIERGRTAGRMEKISVEALLDRILPRLRQRTQPVDLTLEVQPSSNALACLICVDAMAVEQILFNLTDNACKYAAPDSEPRKLDLAIQDENSALRFIFRDYGPGLPEMQRKRLFQPFSKSATEAAHSAPGVGLGLALSRQLARELGGDLIFTQPQGRGAQFELRLPKRAKA
ncbi:sensor histidine kinase [Prosthecobacter dejongeii]|uniref:histidine kinase n=1 Tax=Prosthecobacter dejongeii TaxID=48465 RepID=A0A7W8DQY4_9BACT|nr:HAMP domain-containing sensor histidine kinase [Prosthecobacter dejongeii]MBB5038973.1 signal transduction histidine kinase [Prosthecobacter dejongeii]